MADVSSVQFKPPQPWEGYTNKRYILQQFTGNGAKCSDLFTRRIQ